MTVIRDTRLRREIIEVLRRAGGRIEDSSGHCTPLLAQSLGYVGSITALSGVLRKMELLGLIERRINGKRTLAIALPGFLDKPLEPPVPEPDVDPVADVEPDPVEAPVDPSIPGDPERVAAALLGQVMAKLAEPGVEDLKSRLACVLEENTRLRRRLGELNDELAAVKNERNQLRRDKKLAQDNLKIALETGSRAVRAETTKAIARFMEEVPSGRG